jgi:hypothetical protein
MLKSTFFINEFTLFLQVFQQQLCEHAELRAKESARLGDELGESRQPPMERTAVQAAVLSGCKRQQELEFPHGARGSTQLDGILLRQLVLPGAQKPYGARAPTIGEKNGKITFNIIFG